MRLCVLCEIFITLKLFASPKKVGVLGHSEGSTIGLILAAEGKVDFVVSLAGGVISFEDIAQDFTISLLLEE